MPANTVSHNQLLNLAQQGDANSLTALINQNLFPLGVTVMTVRQGSCLVVTAVLPPHIDRLFLVNFMREGMERLQAKSIQQVVLIGKDRERITPDWQCVLNLHQADLPPVQPVKSSSPAHPVSAPGNSQPLRPITRHPLASKPIRFLLFLATCGLLAGGTWAARTVFLVENSNEPAAPASAIR